MKSAFLYSVGHENCDRNWPFFGHTQRPLCPLIRYRPVNIAFSRPRINSIDEGQSELSLTCKYTLYDELVRSALEIHISEKIDWPLSSKSAMCVCVCVCPK